jgi:hypothetical protein
MLQWRRGKEELERSSRKSKCCFYESIYRIGTGVDEKENHSEEISSTVGYRVLRCTGTASGPGVRELVVPALTFRARWHCGDV